MPDAGPTSERLEALRARWQAEPDSRVFLQLADEYRRLGRAEEAARVLEEGLSANPHHLAAQVALGRCRLDLGDPEEAARLLDGVVQSDPTQMVAYRLLVEAYLRQGRAEEARQRLRIYSLLNDADPEIAELRRRIGEIDRGRAEGPAGAREEAEPGGDAPWSAEPEGLSAESLPEDEEPPASAAGNGDPFPDLAEPSSRRRYLEGLAAGELFEVEVEAAAPSDEVFDLGAPAGAPGPDLSSLLEPHTEPGREAAAEPGWEPAPPEPAPAPTPEPPLQPSARPTVTLGRLYLRQGHTREAEEIFREVLAREPGNDEARRHLEELERPPEAPGRPALELAEEPPSTVEARELLAGYPGNEGLTGRKRFVLERYLERLRGRARRDVH